MEDVINSAAASAEREPVKTYDLKILASVAFVVVGLIVAVYALAAESGPNLSEFASVVVLP
jgi:hypothetical protein